MGLKDFASTVLTRYKADTSDHRQAIKKLRGEQRKLAKQQLEDVEAHNAKLDAQIERWTNVATKVAAAGAAYLVAKNSMNDYVTTQRQMAVTSEVDLNRLVAAADGLVGKYDLMRLSAMNLSGDLKLNQNELEGVAEGVASLVRKGKPLEDVLIRVGDAIREGNVEPLKEFGIVIKDVENDTIEGARAITKALRDLGDTGNPELEKISRSGANMADAMQDAQLRIGELTVKLIPLVDGFAKLLNKLVGISNALGDDTTLGAMIGFALGGPGGAVAGAGVGKSKEVIEGAGFDFWGKGLLLQVADQADARPLFQQIGGPLGGEGSALQQVFFRAAAGDPQAIQLIRSSFQVGSTIGGFNRSLRQNLMQQRTQLQGFEQFGEGRAGQGFREFVLGLNNIVRAGMDARGDGSGIPVPDVAATTSGSAFGGGGGVPGRDFAGAPLDFGFGGVVGQQEFEAGLDRARAGRGVTEDTSPMRTLDEMAQSAVTGSKAFNMFATSAQSAFQAVITGSMSMRDAFKKALGDIIMGKAFDAFSDALLSTGKALFAFATPGGQANGAAFAASAAKNFAIAATLGGIAKRFGAGGAAPGGRGAGNVGPSVRRHREERGDRTFIFGSDFLDESSLERSRRFRRVQSHASATSDSGADLL